MATRGDGRLQGGNKGLQGVTKDYRGFQGVTKGYKALEEVTGSYKG